MSEESFAKKQNEKINSLNNYYRSYLEYYRFRLEKKTFKLVKKYRKDHPADEVKKYENELKLSNEVKINLKKEQLDKRFLKRKEHIEKVTKDENKRVWEIDFVRGFIIIGMLIDHFIGDFWMVTEPFRISNANDFFQFMHRFSCGYWDHPARVAVRLLGVMLLLVLSGISSHFSRKSWFHALMILAFGGIMSAAFGISAVVTGDFSMNVVIGAITCIGLCLLIYNLFKILFNKIGAGSYYKWFSLTMAVTILVMWGFVCYLNPDRRVGGNYDSFWFVYNNYARCIKNLYTPDELKQNLWKVLFGLNYFGADWLAIFPYLGYMFLGGFIGETVYKNKESLLRFIPSKEGERSWNAKFNHATKGVIFCGRKSMWFYLLHQPVYIVLIILLAIFMGLTISI